MICCDKCFSDEVLKTEIKALDNKGDCPVCGRNNVFLYDSDVNAENTNIEELLGSIIKIYVPESKLDNDYPKEKLSTLESKLKSDWNIFEVEESGVKTIIDGVIENAIDLDEELLNGNVGIPELNSEEYLLQNSIMGLYHWEDFRKYLRNQNRFHSKHINLELLAEVLKDTEITIKKNTTLYRARKSSKVGFKRSEMGAPPSDKATAGRANSQGISCLYLCSSKETTIKEIRANAFDYVSIANFRLNRDVKVLDLSIISHNSPFYTETDKVKYMINERHLRKIQNDLAKPITSDDTELDYLPTQYISDFAKFLGYDGVKYISTFDRTAYNVALFDADACCCTYSKNYLIGNLDYKLNPLK